MFKKEISKYNDNLSLATLRWTKLVKSSLACVFIASLGACGGQDTRGGSERNESSMCSIDADNINIEIETESVTGKRVPENTYTTELLASTIHLKMAIREISGLGNFEHILSGDVIMQCNNVAPAQTAGAITGQTETFIYPVSHNFTPNGRNVDVVFDIEDNDDDETTLKFRHLIEAGAVDDNGNVDETKPDFSEFPHIFHLRNCELSFEGRVSVAGPQPTCGGIPSVDANGTHADTYAFNPIHMVEPKSKDQRNNRKVYKSGETSPKWLQGYGYTSTANWFQLLRWDTTATDDYPNGHWVPAWDITGQDNGKTYKRIDTIHYLTGDFEPIWFFEQEEDALSHSTWLSPGFDYLDIDNLTSGKYRFVMLGSVFQTGLHTPDDGEDDSEYRIYYALPEGYPTADDGALRPNLTPQIQYDESYTIDFSVNFGFEAYERGYFLRHPFASQDYAFTTDVLESPSVTVEIASLMPELDYQPRNSLTTFVFEQQEESNSPGAYTYEIDENGRSVEISLNPNNPEGSSEISLDVVDPYGNRLAVTFYIHNTVAPVNNQFLAIAAADPAAQTGTTQINAAAAPTEPVQVTPERIVDEPAPIEAAALTEAAAKTKIIEQFKQNVLTADPQSIPGAIYQDAINYDAPAQF